MSTENSAKTLVGVFCSPRCDQELIISLIYKVLIYFYVLFSIT